LARHLRVRPDVDVTSIAPGFLAQELSRRHAVLHAAFLFRILGLSVSERGVPHDYSSPQSLGRHLRAVLGVTRGFRPPLSVDVALAR